MNLRGMVGGPVSPHCKDRAVAELLARAYPADAADWTAQGTVGRILGRNFALARGYEAGYSTVSHGANVSDGQDIVWR